MILPIRFEERSEKMIRDIRLFNSHPCMQRCYFFARPMSAEVVDDVRVCLSISILFCSVPVIYFMCVFLPCVSFFLVSISSPHVTLRIYVYFFLLIDNDVDSITFHLRIATKMVTDSFCISMCLSLHVYVCMYFKNKLLFVFASPT